ncbi:MAG: rhodanese-like domain-containing protein, partial [Bacteroidota bacterium]
MSVFRIISAVAVILLIGYVVYSQFASGGESMTPDDFVTVWDEGDGILLDVRTPREFEASHLAGAINLNVQSSDFREQVGRLPKTEPIYVYCASGIRSGRAAGILEAM